MLDLRTILSSHQIQTQEDSGICGQLNKKDCYYVKVGGKDALKSWEILRAELKDLHPIIMPEGALEEDRLISKNHQAIEKDFFKYPKIDVQKWFEKHWGDYDFEDEYDEMEEYMEYMEETNEFEGEGASKIPEPTPNHTYSIPYDILSKEPHPSICLVVFPHMLIHELPIYMQYGGWNSCPYPHEQAAIMQYWNQKYGAEIVGVTADIIEMKASRPPRNYEEAFLLAKEQMGYCGDIVFQGTMTVERLAKGLVNSTSWYFWWD